MRRRLAATLVGTIAAAVLVAPLFVKHGQRSGSAIIARSGSAIVASKF